MKEINIDIVWGGIYTSKNEESDSYGVFRLLDFNKYAYHASLYSEEFPAQPTWEDVRDILPFIGHAPIDTRAFFNKTNLTLIGSTHLSKEDFEGYSIYLEHQGVPSEEIKSLIDRLIHFSTQPPLKLKMTLDVDEISIEERL
ncbi:MAG: hypothetical protein AB4372_01235 [Xenococcus sp. (in: cyanobacteria)]